MSKKTFFKIRLYSTVFVALVMWLLLIYQYYDAGVQRHYILHREDLPSFSNWWGGVLLPILTWFLVSRIQKRISTELQTPNFSANILYAFTSALLFGIILSIFFTFGYTELPLYMIIGLFICAIFLPIYRAECFLGFVAGMTFTFGGVLPILIVSVLTLIGALLHFIFRPVIRFAIVQITNLTTSKEDDI